MCAICNCLTRCPTPSPETYLKYSKPIAFAAGAIAFGFNALSGFQNQFFIKAAISVLGAAASTYFAVSAVREEMRIRERQINLLKLAEEVNECAQDHFPTVAIFHCQSDHNGAFDSTNSRFRFLKGGARVALIPATTGEDIHFRDKTPYCVLSGHGTRESVEFRENIFGTNLGSFHISEVRTDSFDFVDRRGTILIDACSTGRPNGLAQRISSLTGRTVHAPHCDIDGGMGWFIMDPNYGLVFLGLDENMDSAISYYRKGKKLIAQCLISRILRKLLLEKKIPH